MLCGNVLLILVLLLVPIPVYQPRANAYQADGSTALYRDGHNEMYWPKKQNISLKYIGKSQYLSVFLPKIMPVLWSIYRLINVYK